MMAQETGRPLVWLITGTTSGFGKRLVNAALSRGDYVIATGRSSDKLDESAKALPDPLKPHYRRLQLDITEGEDSLKVKVREAAGYWGRIDVLVNNAGKAPGFSDLHRVHLDLSSALLRRQYEVNVFAVADTITATLPYIRESRGTIVNIGSRSAWKTDLAGLSAYASSKAALHAFSETLAVEAAPFGVRILIVAPGSFRTEGIYSQPYFENNPIPGYNEAREASTKRFKGVSGTEKGDPGKAMELLVDVVRGEGRAAGKGWPRYLILGCDALDDVTVRANDLLKTVDEWRDVASDVNLAE